MDLIRYLERNFIDLQQLVEMADIDLCTFQGYQKRKWMPNAAYRVNLKLESSSFVTVHQGPIDS